MASVSTNITFCDRSIKDTFQQVYDNDGIEGVRGSVKHMLSEWEDIKIHIGITGKTGSGKSSLINALRNLNGDSEGAAKVGVNQIILKIEDYKDTQVGVNQPTFIIEEYTHPDNTNIVFSDLPGVGTEEFKKETYIQKMDSFSKFEFVIVACDKNVLEIDYWLVKELTSLKKKVFLVRTKVNKDVKDGARKRKTEETILADARHKVEQRMAGVIPKENIFLIDNNKRDHYDFGTLLDRLILNTDSLVREAIVMSFQPITKLHFEEKYNYLKKSIWKTSVLVALAPRIGNADITRLRKEKDRYARYFQLDFVSALDKSTPTFDEYYDLVNSSCEIDEEIVKIENLLPFVPFHNQIEVYNASYKWLKKNLEMMYKRAIQFK